MKLQIFKEGFKYGYIDENRTVVIAAKYEIANDFEDNYAIVKLDGYYGVINTSDEAIIDFLYSAITKHYLFFECKKQDCTKNEQTFWLNVDGTLLHTGKAYVLSENYLCISDGYKHGVIYKNGKTIINCLYDRIVKTVDLFVVLVGNKIGLYDINGNIILNPNYESIESVVIDKNCTLLNKSTSSDSQNTTQHFGYSKDYYFDTNDLEYTISPYTHVYTGVRLDSLYREAVIVTMKWRVYFANQEYNPEYFIETVQTIKDSAKPMILSTGDKKMIFLKSEGILPNSEFDDILQITQDSFVVKKNNLFGVYQLNKKCLTIPIEYESMRFYGGHTILVCKDNLWGAKSVVLTNNIFNTLNKVSIPTKYLEIKILDKCERFFGCRTNDYGSPYTIVHAKGYEIKEINELECDSQFVYIDYDHLITSIQGKFGFVNSHGRKVIPFKYDEIKQRKDRNFDVRISNRWGVMTIKGYEIIPVKYSTPLPEQFNKNTIVEDAESKCYGVIRPDGIEIIPTVYDFLMGSEDDDFYYFGCGGFEAEEYPNSFSGYITDATWGVIGIDGNVIIDANYCNFKVQSDFILAGRDGYNFPDDDDEDYSWSCPNFSGVYDLYNKKGELLIGGFREFEFDERTGVTVFYFGGEWEECSVFDDDWNDIHIKGKRFNKENGLWLILDKDFRTILRDNHYKQKQIEKGFIGKISKTIENKELKISFNIPMDFMAKGFSHVAINSVIVNSNNSNIHNSQAIDIMTGLRTKSYSKIEQISNSFFVFSKRNKVGITNIFSRPVIENCLFITYPVGGYMLIPKEKSAGLYDVFLYKISNLPNPMILAISDIKEEELVRLVDCCWLKAHYDETNLGLKALTLPKGDFWTLEFLNAISIQEERDYYIFSKNNENRYFFSEDCRLASDESDTNDGSSYYSREDSFMDAYGDAPDAYWGRD